MRNEKLLILEGSWAEDGEYISDSRSCTRIYRGVEALMSVQETPVLTVVRPLLACRFPRDIKEFVDLPCNRRGVNVVILAGHGSHEWVKKKDKRAHRRTIQALDSDVNTSVAIREIQESLKRTVFILDSCEIGQGAESFRQASGALGVIGFSKTVDWVDSAVLILALLLRFQQEGVFQMKRMSATRPMMIIEKMKGGAYAGLKRELGMETSFG